MQTLPFITVNLCTCRFLQLHMYLKNYKYVPNNIKICLLNHSLKYLEKWKSAGTNKILKFYEMITFSLVMKV